MQPFPFDSSAGQISTCDIIKMPAIHQSYMPIVNDKTSTFIK